MGDLTRTMLDALVVAREYIHHRAAPHGAEWYAVLQTVDNAIAAYQGGAVDRGPLYDSRNPNPVRAIQSLEELAGAGGMK